ncbi:MAG: hypothetical protein ORO03_08600 [Alphaproteobacteria bacterium]|nr:hypothetical protein [Alphaproteobacteria bacterium]
MTRKTASISLGSYLLDTAKLVAAAATGESLQSFRVFPAGEFRASDGRPHGIAAWVCDQTDAELIIAAFDAKTDDLMVDYDHGWYRALVSKSVDTKVIAAGWIKSLEWRSGAADAGGGLWANAEFTPVAAAHIAAQEYRYISPVFTFDPVTGHVTGLMPCALVNSPAIDGLTDLAAAASSFPLPPNPQTDMWWVTLFRSRTILPLACCKSRQSRNWPAQRQAGQLFNGLCHRH